MGEIDAMLGQFGSDYHKVSDLARERQQTETARDALYDEWACLERAFEDS